MADSESDIQTSFLRKYRNLFNKDQSSGGDSQQLRQLESIPFIPPKRKRKGGKRRKSKVGGKKVKVGGKKRTSKPSKNSINIVGGKKSRKSKKGTGFSNKRSIVAQILKLLVKL